MENSIKKSLWSIWLGQGLFTYIGVKYNTLFGDSDSQIRQKEVSDMLSMISYAEERGEKRGEKRGKKKGEKKV